MTFTFVISLAFAFLWQMSKLFVEFTFIYSHWEQPSGETLTSYTTPKQFFIFQWYTWCLNYWLGQNKKKMSEVKKEKGKERKKSFKLSQQIWLSLLRRAFRPNANQLQWWEWQCWWWYWFNMKFILWTDILGYHCVQVNAQPQCNLCQP